MVLRLFYLPYQHPLVGTESLVFRFQSGLACSPETPTPSHWLLANGEPSNQWYRLLNRVGLSYEKIAGAWSPLRFG